MFLRHSVLRSVSSHFWFHCGFISVLCSGEREQLHIHLGFSISPWHGQISRVHKIKSMLGWLTAWHNILLQTTSLAAPSITHGSNSPPLQSPFSSAFFFPFLAWDHTLQDDVWIERWDVDFIISVQWFLCWEKWWWWWWQWVTNRSDSTTQPVVRKKKI